MNYADTPPAPPTVAGFVMFGGVVTFIVAGGIIGILVGVSVGGAVGYRVGIYTTWRIVTSRLGAGDAAEGRA